MKIMILSVKVWLKNINKKFSGYGNIAPVTFRGQMATIGYSAIGIPLCFVFLANVGSALSTLFTFVYR